MSKPAMQEVWQRTFFLYRSGWKQHFLTALPPAVLSVLVYVAGDLLLVELSRGFRLTGEMDRTFWSLILRTLAVRLPQFALPWLMTTFAFAAVSSAVLGNDTKEHLHSIADSYTSARERVRPILTVGLITFLLAVAGYAAVAMCAQTIAFSQLVPRAYRGFALMTILYVGLVIWLGLLSRAGLSIPYLMQHEGAGAWNSVKASVSRSEGYEPFFVLLIVQTVFCSVWGPWLGRQVLFWFWRKSLIGPKTVEWLGYSLDALVPAAVETFLFVGFTVLFIELNRTANEAIQKDFSSEAVRAAPIPNDN